MSTKDEINAMFDALEGGIGGNETDAPTTKQPVDNKTEPPTTDEPVVTDEPTTDEPETKAPTTDAPVEDEAARIKAENEELKRKIDELQKAPKTKPPTTKPPTTDPPIAEEDFLKGIDLEDIEERPAELNKVLNLIYKKAVQQARAEMKKSGEVFLREVPKIVTSDLSAQEKMKKITDNFYKENADLKKFPKVVGIVFDELVGENPGKKPEEILAIVADKTRDRLGLKKPAKKPDDKSKNKDKDNPPPLHRSKGKRSSQSKQETSNASTEIDEMNKSLNR